MRCARHDATAPGRRGNNVQTASAGDRDPDTPAYPQGASQSTRGLAAILLDHQADHANAGARVAWREEVPVSHRSEKVRDEVRAKLLR